jgi:hypothetical protein
VRAATAISVSAGFCSGKEIKETYCVENLKIVEGYQVAGLPVATTANGQIIDVAAKTPILVTVTISDWIVEALSKDYLRLSIFNKLSFKKSLLPIIYNK